MKRFYPFALAVQFDGISSGGQAYALEYSIAPRRTLTLAGDTSIGHPRRMAAL